MNNKKVISIILTIILTLTLLPSSFAAEPGGKIYTTSENNQDYFVIEPRNVPTESSVVLACFNGGKYAGLYSCVYDGADIIKFPINKSFVFDSLKLMIWEDMSSFVPLCESHTILSSGQSTIKYMTDDSTEYKVQNKYNNIPALIVEDIPAKDGKIFGGWASASNENVVYQPGDVYSLNGHTTLYAIWNSPATPTPEPTATPKPSATANPTPRPTATPTAEVSTSEKYAGYDNSVYDFGYYYQLPVHTESEVSGIKIYKYDITDTDLIDGNTFNRTRLSEGYVEQFRLNRFVTNTRMGQDPNTFYLYNSQKGLWVEVISPTYFSQVKKDPSIEDPGVYYMTIRIFYGDDQ